MFTELSRVCSAMAHCCALHGSVFVFLAFVITLCNGEPSEICSAFNFFTTLYLRIISSHGFQKLKFTYAYYLLEIPIQFTQLVCFCLLPWIISILAKFNHIFFNWLSSPSHPIWFSGKDVFVQLLSHRLEYLLFTVLSVNICTWTLLFLPYSFYFYCSITERESEGKREREIRYNICGFWKMTSIIAIYQEILF